MVMLKKNLKKIKQSTKRKKIFAIIYPTQVWYSEYI